MPNIIRLGGGASAELDGNALPADVLTGKTFYSTDPETKQTGSMANNSGTSQAATSEQASNQYRLKIPAAGYYDANANIYRTYANVAADIGLTAAKIASGNTILGIAGTYAPTPTLRTGYGTFSCSLSVGSYDSNTDSGSRITISMTNLGFFPLAMWASNASNTTAGRSTIAATRPASGTSGVSGWAGVSGTQVGNTSFVSATWGNANVTIVADVGKRSGIGSTNPVWPTMTTNYSGAIGYST